MIVPPAEWPPLATGGWLRSDSEEGLLGRHILAVTRRRFPRIMTTTREAPTRTIAMIISMYNHQDKEEEGGGGSGSAKY